MAKEEMKDGTGINAAKLKALQATIDKIEKDYGKGTIMKLEISQNGKFRSFRADPLPSMLHSASADTHAEESSRSTDQSPAVRQPSPSTPSHRRRNRAVLQLSSMLSMRSTGPMQRTSELTSTHCSSRSLTTESRPLRSQTTSSVQERLTSS